VTSATKDRMRRITVLCALAFAPFGYADGQSPVQIRVGDRLRVATVDMQHDGPLESVSGNELTVGGHSFQLPSLTRLEVHRGYRGRAGRGALMGAGALGAAGLAWAIVGCNTTWPCDGSDGDFRPIIYAVSGGGGAVIGAIFGALIGSQIKSDRWEDVPLNRVRVNVVPSGGPLRLGFTLVF
jgi:hypothetical protein